VSDDDDDADADDSIGKTMDSPPSGGGRQKRAAALKQKGANLMMSLSHISQCS